MIEAVVVLAVLIGGCLFILGLGIRGWAVPTLGYVAGTCLLIDFGFIQIALGLPTNPLLTLILTVGVPLCWWLSRPESKRFPYGAIQVTVILLAVICIVYIFRNANFVGWNPDTLRYLMSGALIASNNLDTLPGELMAARLLAFPILHAPANLAGEFYLRSVGPLLAISCIGLFVWLSLNGLARSRAHWPVAFTTLGVLLLLTNGRMLWSAFALFPHLLTAVLMLVIAGCGWLLAGIPEKAENGQIDQSGLIALQAIAIPALIVARPEGGMMVVIAFLPTLLCRRVWLKHRTFLLCVFGASLAAWNLLLLSYQPMNVAIPVSIVGHLTLAILALTAASLLYLRPVRDYTAVLEHCMYIVLILVEAALWIALAVAAVGNPSILLESINATGHNLLLGDGRWGYSLVILMLFVLFCAVAVRGGELIFLRFPVTSFVPLAFLLMYLRGHPYRIGVGDSLNRMWVHIVPLAILFVVAAASSPRWGYRESDSKVESTRRFA